MAKSAIERLKELEELDNAAQLTSAEANEKHQAERQAIEAEKDAYWTNVVSVAIYQAEHELKSNGWQIGVAHQTYQRRDQTTILATLPRKKWTVTLVFLWPTDSTIKLRAHWGRPDIHAGGSTANFEVGVSTVEQVKEEIMDLIVKATEHGTRKATF